MDYNRGEDLLSYSTKQQPFLTGPLRVSCLVLNFLTSRTISSNIWNTVRYQAAPTAPCLSHSHLIYVGVVLGWCLHEDNEVPQLPGEGLPLLLADDSLMLQVVLVPEDHDRGQDSSVVRVLCGALLILNSKERVPTLYLLILCIIPSTSCKLFLKRKQWITTDHWIYSIHLSVIE